jgi:hypothetical protein
VLPFKPKTQPERSTSLLSFLLPTTHFLSPHLPNFSSFQPIVAEDKRGLPANSSDSLALCSKSSACHCTPIPFPNWPCHNSECQSSDLAAETWVQTQVSSCEICGGRSDTGTGFSSSAPVSPFSTIPPMRHTHLHLNFAFTRKTKAKPGNLPKSGARRKSDSTGQKILSLSLVEDGTCPQIILSSSNMTKLPCRMMDLK